MFQTVFPSIIRSSKLYIQRQVAVRPIPGPARLAAGRVKMGCDGTRVETRFGLPAKRTSPFISAGLSVQLSTGFLGVRVGGERLQ